MAKCLSKTLRVLIAISLPSVCVYGDTFLEQQVANHFKSYLEEKNAAVGNEVFGGPFEYRQYDQKSQSFSEKRVAVHFTYKVSMDMRGDPNELIITAEYLLDPVDLRISNISQMDDISQNPALFEKLGDILKIIEPEQPVCDIQIFERNRVSRRPVEKDLYCYGFVSIGPDRWQVFMRRGHRIEWGDVELGAGYVPHEEYSQEAVDLSSAEKAHKTDSFLLYGRINDNNLWKLSSFIQNKGVPIAAIWVDQKAAWILSGQDLKGKPFKHPYLNCPIYSVVLEKRGLTYQCISLSKIQSETPEGLRQTFNDPGILLNKPSEKSVYQMIPGIIWSEQEAVYRKHLTKADIFAICEIYLRLPAVKIDSAAMPPSIYLEDGASTVVVSPPYSDFGEGVRFVKKGGRWRVQAWYYGLDNW